MKKVSRKARSEWLLKAWNLGTHKSNALANTFFVKSEGFDHLVNPALHSTQAALILVTYVIKNVIILCSQLVRYLTEARFRELKRLRSRFDNSPTIHFLTLHLTQKFLLNRVLNRLPNRYRIVNFEPYYWLSVSFTLVAVIAIGRPRGFIHVVIVSRWIYDPLDDFIRSILMKLFLPQCYVGVHPRRSCICFGGYLYFSHIRSPGIHRSHMTQICPPISVRANSTRNA